MGDIILVEYKIKGKRAAIVIGIDKYENKKIPVLSGAENDAMELSKVLSEHGSFQIIHQLIGTQATSDAIRQKLSDIFWKPEEAYDLVLFYFSGHGRGDNSGNGYIAPYNMDMEAPLVYGINMKEINNIISVYYNNFKFSNLYVLLILDCCHSIHAIPQDEGYKGGKIGSPQGFLSGVEELKGQGKVILVSGDVDEKSREDEFAKCLFKNKDEKSHKHGILTGHLLQGLAGNALERSGFVTYRELESYVNRSMKEMKQKPFSLTYGTQIPDIRLTISSKEHEQYIKKKKELYQQRIKRSSIFDVFHCSLILKDLEYTSGNEIFVNSCIRQINGILNLYNEKIMRWIASNSSHIDTGIFLYENKIGRRTAIKTAINSLTTFLSYNKIKGIDNMTLSLMDTVFNYANKNINFSSQDVDSAFSDEDSDIISENTQPNYLKEFVEKSAACVPITQEIQDSASIGGPLFISDTIRNSSLKSIKYLR